MLHEISCYLCLLLFVAVNANGKIESLHIDGNVPLLEHHSEEKYHGWKLKEEKCSIVVALLWRKVATTRSSKATIVNRYEEIALKIQHLLCWKASSHHNDDGGSLRKTWSIFANDSFDRDVGVIVQLICCQPQHKDKNLAQSSPRKMKEKRPIKVYIRVRPFNKEEEEREEARALEIFKEENRIKVLDERHSLETSYFFDGVFGAEDNNEAVYLQTAKPLVNKLLRGINCALLTYGQTGTGKTHTVLAEGSVTNFTIKHLFERISQDVSHKYKVLCSFVQVYQDKVYDMLSPDSKDELFLREHPKKGIYVANLSYHVVNSAEDALSYLNMGRKELIIAETKMVRHSSRSHAIFQLCFERRVDPDRAKHVSETNIQDEKLLSSRSSDLNNSHETEDDKIDPMMMEEDLILRGKIDICDLAGSERLGKTMAEGVRLSEAKHINSSLLELGNVIYALSDGTKRHIPFRNSTLTRLLQVCLGPQCRTSFIVCVAPTASEAYETRCSLNFGTRARKITNKERLILNVEVDYKILSKRLAKRIELLESQLEDGSQAFSLKKNDLEAPITIETQTSDSCLELSSCTIANNSISDAPEQSYLIPKLEIVIISELMNTLFTNTLGGKMKSLENNEVSLIPRIGTLLHDLVCVILSRKQHLSTSEVSWTEIDLEQVLKESLDDLDLMREASGLDDDASVRANDLAKYADYVCNRMEERCRKTEDDIGYCLERFSRIISFDQGSNIHQKIKKLIEFLENNQNTELPPIAINHDADLIDFGFLSWMVNVHMALRLSLLILHVGRLSSEGLAQPRIAIATEEEQSGGAREELNTSSFAKISSFASLGEYATSEFYTTTASTPKRTIPLPMSIQNQIHSTKIRPMISIEPELSFDLLHPQIGGNGGFNLASCFDSKSWLHKDKLNVSVASGFDSMDDFIVGESEVDMLRQRQLQNASMAKFEDKCLSLEDKNAKLRRTLNVIMKENKDLKDKMSAGNAETKKAVKELELAEMKLQRVTAENSSLGRNLQALQMEGKRWEGEALKLNTENHQNRIDMLAIKKQVETKTAENELLKEQVSELQITQSMLTADREFLSKQLEEKEKKLEEDGEKFEDVYKEKEKLLHDVKTICAMLEQQMNERVVNEDAALSGGGRRKRSKSIDASDGNDATFETELFVAIENNIRIESIVGTVKSKLEGLICGAIDSGDVGKDMASLKSCSGKETVAFAVPNKVTMKTTVGNSQRQVAASKGGRAGTETRASALRRSKSLKAASTAKKSDATYQQIGRSKETGSVGQVKGTKIKELMNEKIKVETNYKELAKRHVKLEEELKTAKNQIEMLVNECGTLDHELGKYKNSKRIVGCESVERSLTSGSSCASDDGDNCEKQGSSLFLRTKEIENLGDRHQELKRTCEEYEGKIKQLELDLESSRDEYMSVKRQIRDAERQCDDTACELRHFKTQAYAQKVDCARLKEHLVQLGQELSKEQQRSGQLTVKLSTTKERYAMQIGKMETELLKCAKRLDRYRERERAAREETKRREISGKDSSVNEADSGLMPDQSEDYLDLT
eukprot:gene20469-22485_t